MKPWKLGLFWRRDGDNIKTDLRESGCESTGRIQTAEEARVRTTDTNPREPHTRKWHFLTSWATASFSRTNLHHGVGLLFLGLRGTHAEYKLPTLSSILKNSPFYCKSMAKCTSSEFLISKLFEMIFLIYYAKYALAASVLHYRLRSSGLLTQSTSSLP